MTDDDDEFGPPTGLEALDDDALLDLASAEYLDVTLLERVIREVARRDVMETAKVEGLIKRFVHGSLTSLRGTFMTLFELHWSLDGLQEAARGMSLRSTLTGT